MGHSESTKYDRLEWCFYIISVISGQQLTLSMSPGFHQYKAGTLKYLAQEHSHKQEGQDGPGSLT